MPVSMQLLLLCAGLGAKLGRAPKQTGLRFDPNFAVRMFGL
ncbi:hypothetical protein J2Z75_005884 [Rhizobium herbae]|uniref:Uncharacterized protein n=1 Tax=Rhizobium herbae TaxID=508661 RepID=A0ABS4EWK4_9HYPH|nr:hypothetical protein [Rhizobium herbae]